MPAGFLVVFVLVVVVIAVCATLLLKPTRYEPRPSKPVSVQIVVLGDIGHSPRMQYHALSIAKHGGQVSIVGYQESTPNQELLQHERISIVALPPAPAFLRTSNKYLFPFLAALKLANQTWYLWSALAYRSPPSRWMLVQNPPAAPTLVLAQLACWLRDTRLIVDWHNFGYSILALKLGKGHTIVKLAKIYEMSFCRAADAHFCVSNAMARVLREEASIRAPVLVLHDRPPAVFQPMASELERMQFLSSLPETTSHVDDILSGRCRLVVSSTSWTPDEDFSVLLDALCQYSAMAATSRPDLPDLLVIITGKGPQKAYYLSRVATLTAEGKLAKVKVETAWLSHQHYASLLAAACLGVCLHTSSSGVDLPMKVVDMFGAGLPVLGWNRYPSWPELVTEEVNGRGFGSSNELLSHLVDLFDAKNRSALDRLRAGALAESRRRWDGQWDPIAGKLLQLT